MLHLPNVTLVAYTSVRIPETIKALEYSCRGIQFAQVKLLSDITPSHLPSYIQHQLAERSGNIDEWNYNIIYNLPKYIDTDFCILIHDDGFIVHPSSWRDEFLQYDYIGAPWPIPKDVAGSVFTDIYGHVIRQGNSVSLRSKKLLDVPLKLHLEWMPYKGIKHEDTWICVGNRHTYIEQGCRFADVDVAKYFSHEVMVPEVRGIHPFAFHQYRGKNKKYPKWKTYTHPIPKFLNAFQSYFYKTVYTILIYLKIC